jgi:hypothetical protein
MSAIISIIWKFLGPTVVNLAITVGLPKAVEYLMSKGLPKWLVDGIVAIVKAALDEIDGIDPALPTSERKVQVKAIRVAAKKKARELGPRTGVASETKGLG